MGEWLHSCPREATRSTHVIFTCNISSTHRLSAESSPPHTRTPCCYTTCFTFCGLYGAVGDRQGQRFLVELWRSTTDSRWLAACCADQEFTPYQVACRQVLCKFWPRPPRPSSWINLKEINYFLLIFIQVDGLGGLPLCR